MKLAIMQPYFMPYIGYFQLINAVDRFVLYDELAFIKRGWINRNCILVNSKHFLFTIPIEHASSFALIRDSFIKAHLYPKWKATFLNTLKYSYKKAPYFDPTYCIIENILNAGCKTISELAIMSVKETCNYMKINTELIVSSEEYNHIDSGRLERIFDICKKEGARKYINAIGGQALYKKEKFAKEGIELNFIKSLPIEYKQFNNQFVPWLSIIDVMMFNPVEEINEMLDQYELI